MTDAEAPSCIEIDLGHMLCKQSQTIYNRKTAVIQREMALLNYLQIQPSHEILKLFDVPEWIQVFNPSY